jgi:hypothetical protein
MPTKISMKDVILTCNASQDSYAKNKTKVFVGGSNDPSISKAMGYNQYVKTSRPHPTPVKAYFGYNANGQITQNQSLAQAYGLGVRFI